MCSLRVAHKKKKKKKGREHQSQRLSPLSLGIFFFFNPVTALSLVPLSIYIF